MAANARIEELRKRLEKEPGSRLFAQLAEELRKDGDLEEAINVCRAGLQKHPAYPSARMTLGRALFDTGDLASARGEFENVIKGAPDNILASRMLAECLEGLGDLPGARARYRATLLLAPGDKHVAARLQALEGPGGRAPGAAGPPTAAGVAGSPPGAAAAAGLRPSADPGATRAPGRAAPGGAAGGAAEDGFAAPLPSSSGSTPTGRIASGAAAGDEPDQPPIPLAPVEEGFELERPFEAARAAPPPPAEREADEAPPIPLVRVDDEHFELERPYEAAAVASTRSAEEAQPPAAREVAEFELVGEGGGAAAPPPSRPAAPAPPEEAGDFSTLPVGTRAPSFTDSPPGAPAPTAGVRPVTEEFSFEQEPPAASVEPAVEGMPVTEEFEVLSDAEAALAPDPFSPSAGRIVASAEPETTAPDSVEVQPSAPEPGLAPAAEDFPAEAAAEETPHLSAPEAPLHEDAEGPTGVQEHFGVGLASEGDLAPAVGALGGGGLPSEEIASLTLAELYYNQGFPAKAADVLRELVSREPRNERAASRLRELEARERAVLAEEWQAAASPGAPADPQAARRQAIQRAIRSLEAMLAAVRRG